MSTRKSPFYTVLGVVFGLIVLAGGAAKFYRGLSGLTSTGLNPKVKTLLEESDAAIAVANQQTSTVVPAFQQLLTDFDTLGVANFRAERREACATLTDQYTTINDQLQTASNKIKEAIKLGIDANTTAFLDARSKSYSLLVDVTKHNLDIIRTLLDESVVDTDAIVAKVQSIAENRALAEKAANEATAAADALLKRPS